MLQPSFEVRRYRGDVVTHSHDFHQVMLPLEGRLNMVVNGTEGCVAARRAQKSVVPSKPSSGRPVRLFGVFPHCA